MKQAVSPAFGPDRERAGETETACATIVFHRDAYASRSGLCFPKQAKPPASPFHRILNSMLLKVTGHACPTLPAARAWLAVLPLCLSFCAAQTPRTEVNQLLRFGQRAQAEAVASHWLSDVQARGDQQTAAAADALDAMALCAATGKPEATAQVRELAGQAIAIKGKIGGTAASSIPASMGILGSQQADSGDYDGAQKTLEDALLLADADRNSLQAADLCLRLSEVYWIKGKYERCQDLGRRALAIYEKEYGPDHPATAAALASIASDFTASGDYAQATPLFERAAAIQESKLGTGSPEFGRTLNKLAFNFLRLGEYAQAKIDGERAVNILEASVGDRLPVTGEAERTLGHILTELGDFGGAEQAQKRGLEILEKQVGPDSVLVGDALISLGNSAKDSGGVERAKAFYSRALQIYEARLGPENTKVGGALDNLGQTLVLLKDYDGARASLERAIAIQTKALGPRNVWVGNLYQGLAKVAAATGQYAEAKRLLERNLDIWREQLGPTHPYTVVSTTLMADVLARMGDRGSALDTALEATRIRHDDVAFTVRTVDEQQALRYASKKTNDLDTVLTLAAAAPADGRRAAWDALIHSRALVLDEMAARHRTIHESHDPEIASLAGEVDRTRADLARLVVLGKGSKAPAAYLTAMNDGRSQVYRAEQALAVKSANYRTQLERERAGFTEVSRGLPRGSAMIAFARYQQGNYSTPESTPVASYMAFVLRAGERAPRALRLGSAARIDRLVAGWRAEIDRERISAGHSERRNEAASREAGEALRAAVWDPITATIAGAREVFIVPDGSLQFLNFTALPSGSSHYLIEDGPLLHTLSAERDIALPPARLPGHEMLAIGNPAYQAASPGQLTASAIFRGGHSSCGDFAKLQFESLPDSAVEVRELVDIWNRPGWKAEALLGAGATEAALKELVPGKRVVHIATHGFFLDQDCREAAVVKENPLLRSGLALAGANRRNSAGPQSEDGILTAEEAASLDLRQTEWLVLSGCDTGLGDVKAGEGVLGLRRAFQEAGARTVIASLWPVQDVEAREWMVALYRARFVNNAGTAEAVRDASLRELASRRAAGKSTHPFHWASFVAVGDWR